jgi:hypothetical protein
MSKITLMRGNNMPLLRVRVVVLLLLLLIAVHTGDAAKQLSSQVVRFQFIIISSSFRSLARSFTTMVPELPSAFNIAFAFDAFESIVQGASRSTHCGCQCSTAPITADLLQARLHSNARNVFDVAHVVVIVHWTNWKAAGNSSA